MASFDDINNTLKGIVTNLGQIQQKPSRANLVVGTTTVSGSGAGFLTDNSGVLGETPLNQVTTWFNVLSFGADPTGASNSTIQIQNAINAAAANGGGTVFFPPGTYLISDVLNITTSFVKLIGAGAGYGNQPGTGSGSTVLNWAGGNAPLILIQTIAGSAFPIAGNSVQGMLLDGMGAANVGIKSISGNSSSLIDVMVQGTTLAAYLFTCLKSQDPSGTTSGPADSQTWFIDRCFFDCETNPASINADGFVFSGDVDTGYTANFSLNIVQNCRGNHFNGAGYVLDFVDSTQFINCSSFADNYDPGSITNYHGGGASFVCHGNATGGFSSGDGNTFYGCQWGAFVIQGTESGYVSGTNGNNIAASCEANPSPFPVLGTGVRFFGPLDTTTFGYGGMPTWTPMITPETGAITAYAVNEATWSYHGTKVYFAASIAITTKGTASGYLKISMPPIDFSNTGGHFTFPTVQGFNAGQGTALMGYIFDFSTMYFTRYDNGTPFTADGDTIILSGWYDVG